MIDTTNQSIVKIMVQKIDHFLSMYAKYRGWGDMCYFSEDTDCEGRKYNTLFIYGDQVYEKEYTLLSDSIRKKYDGIPEATRKIQYIVDNYPEWAHAIMFKFNLLLSPSDVVPEDFEKMNTYYKILRAKAQPF